jgi:hypothetical protein
MAPAERALLTQELFDVHCQIFSGLSYDEFKSYVVERQAWRTWIYVKKSEQGETVGYTAVHVFLLDVDGRPSTVIRMEAGTLPAWRGRDVTMVYAIGRLLRVWMLHPWRRTCIFAALTHPSSYTFLAHYAPVIFPHVKRKLPREILEEMEKLAACFDLERVDPINPLLRRVDWVTLESEEDHLRWSNSKRRDTRFYMKANPFYTQGTGLMTYIPVTGPILLRSLRRFVASRAGRIMRLMLQRPPKAADSSMAPLDSRAGSFDSHLGRLKRR